MPVGGPGSGGSQPGIISLGAPGKGIIAHPRATQRGIILPDASAYAAEVMADVPVLYWRLGEKSGTTAFDNSGAGHNGAYTGSLYTLGTIGLLSGGQDPGVALAGSLATEGSVRISGA